MCTPGSKTPVSILNEYLIRKGSLPKYDLILNGCRFQNPSFAYVVQFEEYSALGEGRSKQEAKHQAARKMLELLNISCDCEYEEDVKQLVVPCENNIGYNAVGLLAEYCRKSCYPEVIYECLSEAGPPHARTFTMKCCVSKLVTIGVARTKKEAKHIAAHKMLMQLQLEAGEEPMAVAIPKKKPTIDDPNLTESPRINRVYQPQAYLYKDYCNAYLGLEEKSETLAKILEDWNIVTLENACKLVHDISEELKVDLRIEKASHFNVEQLPLNVLEEDFHNHDERPTANNHERHENVFITMVLHPPVVGLDSDIQKAALSLLEFLRELSS